VAEIEKIALVPCQPFQLTRREGPFRGALKNLPTTARKTIEENPSRPGQEKHGWLVMKVQDARFRFVSPDDAGMDGAYSD
jgi:hypothetical protein